MKLRGLGALAVALLLTTVALAPSAAAAEPDPGDTLDFACVETGTYTLGEVCKPDREEVMMCWVVAYPTSYHGPDYDPRSDPVACTVGTVSENLADQYRHVMGTVDDAVPEECAGHLTPGSGGAITWTDLLDTPGNVGETLDCLGIGITITPPPELPGGDPTECEPTGDALKPTVRGIAAYAEQKADCVSQESYPEEAYVCAIGMHGFIYVCTPDDGPTVEGTNACLVRAEPAIAPDPSYPESYLDWYVGAEELHCDLGDVGGTYDENVERWTDDAIYGSPLHCADGWDHRSLTTTDQDLDDEVREVRQRAGCVVAWTGVSIAHLDT